MMLFIGVPTGIEVSAGLGISWYMPGTACSYSFKRHELASIYLPLVLCAGAVGLSSNLWVLLLGNSSLHGAKVQHPVVLCCIPGVLPQPKIESPDNQGWELPFVNQRKVLVTKLGEAAEKDLFSSRSVLEHKNIIHTVHKAQITNVHVLDQLLFSASRSSVQAQAMLTEAALLWSAPDWRGHNLPAVTFA